MLRSIYAAIRRYFSSSSIRRMPRPIANLCAGAVFPVFEEETKRTELKDTKETEDGGN